MHLVLDILQGIGIAAAVGIRPFLPALLVGALAAGDIQIDFAHSSYSFLQDPLFLLIMLFGVVVLALLERRATAEALQIRLVRGLLTVCSLALGALLFAGALAQDHDAVWPGLIAGVLCAGVGLAATVPLLTRVRTRLDAESAGALPLFTEGGAVIGALLAVLLPGVGVVLLAGLVWLLVAGRGREQQKFAGLRILR